MNTLKSFSHTTAALCRHAAIIILMLVTVISSRQASATTLVPTNLAKISELAKSAFVIRIQNVETSSSAGKSFDIISGAVVDPIFGDVKTSEVLTWNQFRFARKVRMPAMPEYQVGQEYLIFLSGPGPGTGYQSPIGLGQGAFTVKRNPATGAALVRSMYMNSGLMAGLDTDAVARDLISSDPRTRGMSPAQARDEVQKLKAKLSRPGPGISLDLIKSAARMFHQEKQRGNSPARDYRTTTPARARTLQ